MRKFLFSTYLLYLLRVVPLCMFSVTAVQTARRRERAKICYFYCLIDSEEENGKGNLGGQENYTEGEEVMFRP